MKNDYITSLATPSVEKVFETREANAEYEQWLDERQSEWQEREDNWDRTIAYADSL